MKKVYHNLIIVNLYSTHPKNCIIKTCLNIFGYENIFSKQYTDPNKPNNVSNGTINISAPPPITPALKPLIIPIIVKPR